MVREVLEVMSDPTKTDSHNDGFSDSFEYQLYNSDPNNSLSKLAVISTISQSFEENIAGWSETDDSDIPWEISTKQASTGTKSLLSGSMPPNKKSAVKFNGTFVSGLWSFDIKTAGNGSFELYVYVDGNLELTLFSYYAWRTKSIPLLSGEHEITFEVSNQASYQQSNFQIWIDNIQFIAD